MNIEYRQVGGRRYVYEEAESSDTVPVRAATGAGAREGGDVPCQPHQPVVHRPHRVRAHPGRRATLVFVPKCAGARPGRVGCSDSRVHSTALICRHAAAVVAPKSHQRKGCSDSLAACDGIVVASPNEAAEDVVSIFLSCVLVCVWSCGSVPLASAFVYSSACWIPVPHDRAHCCVVL